jgi:hypothetical protein
MRSPTLGERALRLVFGISLGDYRWGLAHFIAVALGGVLWATVGGYAALLLVAHLPQLGGLPSGFLTTTIYIRNIEATALFVVVFWGPLALALNARRDADTAFSPTVMGLIAGGAAVIFRLAFLSHDNPMADSDPVSWTLPFLLALFSVIPTATVAQRTYVRRRRAWEVLAATGARLHENTQIEDS